MDHFVRGSTPGVLSFFLLSRRTLNPCTLCTGGLTADRQRLIANRRRLTANRCRLPTNCRLAHAPNTSPHWGECSEPRRLFFFCM